LTHDVADGEDVRYFGAHLNVDVDETMVGDGHASLAGGNILAVGVRSTACSTRSCL
jgi:hypothetical protein